MIRNVFWLEPYRTELETRVLGVTGCDLTLEQTIFYAFSGGQESDRGTIGGHRVLEARKTESEICYTLAADHGLSPGDAVTVAIDWARRYRLMRLHFAAELVLELVTRRLAPIEKIGAHIAEDKARIDFLCDRGLAEHLAELTREARAIVGADQPITSAFSDEARGQRYWEIAGFSRVPCGGTHLKTTGEVGDLVLKRKNPGKGKERIEIYLADPGGGPGPDRRAPSPR
jgi:Ser-tRNA(Ala) deacylase AlaX